MGQKNSYITREILEELNLKELADDLKNIEEVIDEVKSWLWQRKKVRFTVEALFNELLSCNVSMWKNSVQLRHENSNIPGDSYLNFA